MERGRRRWAVAAAHDEQSVHDSHDLHQTYSVRLSCADLPPRHCRVKCGSGHGVAKSTKPREHRGLVERPEDEARWKVGVRVAANTHAR